MALPGATRRGRELATRVVVGAGLAAVALGCLWAGPLAWTIFVAATAGAAAWELSRLNRIDDLVPFTLVFALVFATPFTRSVPESRYLIFALGVAVLVALITLVGQRRNIVVQTLSALYVGLPAFALVGLRSEPFGVAWVLYTISVVCAADIAAYAVGRLAGGPKLWPRISPGKTWAGFAGACLAAMAASVAVWSLIEIGRAGSASIDVHYHLPIRPAIAGLLLGALAQGGDLFESWLKRRAGVKDSGTLLPGHGGVLDRLDSLVPVAPVVAGAVWLGWL